MSGQGETPAKRICVVLDTNVWIYEAWLLRTALGAALTHALVRAGGVLGLPEVVEDELTKHAVGAGREAVDKVRTGLSRIAWLTGSVRGDADLLYTEDQFEASAKKRLRELDDLLERVPFTLEHARSALGRVNEGTPPNGPKNQQFKDSAIWEAVLDLSREYDVHLVTKDKAFFADGSRPQRGLATNLAEECDATGAMVRAHLGLAPCLEALAGGVPRLDERELAKAVSYAVLEDLHAIAADKEFDLGELANCSVSAFLTEQTDVLALSFNLDYEASTVPAQGGPPVKAKLAVAGDCSFDIRTRSASNVRLDRVWLLDGEGNLVGNKGVSYLYAGFDSGDLPKSGPYELRVPVDGQEFEDLLRNILRQER